MAKKKAEPAAAAGDKGPGITKVVNHALDALGVEAAISDVESWLKTNYPTWAYNRSTLSSTLSQQRNKRRGGGKVDGRSMRRHAVAPSLEDLFTVKKHADDHGGMPRLLEMVSSIDELAGKVGGMDQLKKCLSGLAKLGGN